MQYSSPISSRKQVICIGGANLDRKLRLSGDLHMGTSNPVRHTIAAGGVARNLAANFIQLGQVSRLVAAVGADGAFLLDEATELGIDTALCLRCRDEDSDSYTAVIDEAGELVLGLANMHLCARLHPEFLASLASHLLRADLLLADLNLSRASLNYVCAFARRQNIPLVLLAVSEAKMQHLPQDLRGVRLMICNRGELAAWHGLALPDVGAMRDAATVLQARGVAEVAITLGAQGLAYASDTEFAEFAAPKVEVLDVTGAGDALAAGLCSARILEGLCWQEACARGLALAAQVLQSESSSII